MLRTSTSGLLLLLIGVIGLSAFVSGNLDQLLGKLFSATPATTATKPAGASTSTTGGGGSIATATARTSA